MYANAALRFVLCSTKKKKYYLETENVSEKFFFSCLLPLLWRLTAVCELFAFLYNFSIASTYNAGVWWCSCSVNMISVVTNNKKNKVFFYIYSMNNSTQIMITFNGRYSFLLFFGFLAFGKCMRRLLTLHNFLFCFIIYYLVVLYISLLVFVAIFEFFFMCFVSLLAIDFINSIFGADDWTFIGCWADWLYYNYFSF